MDALSLFATDPKPPRPAGLHLARVEDHLPTYCDLAIVDPPWLYTEAHGESVAQDHYPGLSTPVIVEHLGRILAKRLVCWITFPIWTAEWPESLPGWGRPVTAGAWFKSGPEDSGHYGQGFHWAGCAEAVLVYTRPDAYNARTKLRNAWHSPPEEHSRKPVEWQRQMIQRWCPPGGHVFEPYAGLASALEATHLAGEGRTCFATEANPKRFRDAVALLDSRGVPWKA